MDYNPNVSGGRGIGSASLTYDGELTVFGSAVDDWHNSVDVYVDPVGDPAAVNALVRVYAATRGIESEVARGRVGAGPARVLRTRGWSGETFRISIQRDPATGVAKLVKPSRVAFAAHGVTATPEDEPLTSFDFNAGVSSLVSGLPTWLYGINATNLGGVAAWLWVFDAVAVPGGAPVPIVPPIPIPSGGAGQAGMSFDRRPYRTTRGLVLASSVSATLFTPAGAPSLSTIVEYS